MSALDKRIADLAQVKKALLIRLEDVEREIQQLYRLRYDILVGEEAERRAANAS